jgi:hypothetical protein
MRLFDNRLDVKAINVLEMLVETLHVTSLQELTVTVFYDYVIVRERLTTEIRSAH